jgi:hypothetical protein
MRSMAEGACRLHLSVRQTPSTAFGGPPPPLRFAARGRRWTALVEWF